MTSIKIKKHELNFDVKYKNNIFNNNIKQKNIIIIVLNIIYKIN